MGQLCTGIRVQTDVHEAPRVCENRTGYQDRAGQRNCTAGRVILRENLNDREWQSANTYSSQKNSDFYFNNLRCLRFMSKYPTHGTHIR